MFDAEFATATARVAAGAVVCALIGQGISRSLTPPMHEREAACHGIDYTYLTLDVPAGKVDDVDLADVLARARRAGLRGMNVTHPFKQQIIAHLDELSDDARRLGAVNTVVFDRAADGSSRTIGHNTDWSGFARNFERGFGAGSDNPVALGKVVQLGAGGAGSAVAYAMAGTGVEHFHLVDHDPARAHALAETLRPMFPDVTITAGGTDRAVAELRDADGLVHATPIGMAAHPGMAVPAEAVTPGLWVAEVVYRPVITELIATARAAGARTLTGDGMAVHQAVDALALFAGIEPDAARMTRHIGDLISDEDTELRQPA